jgi:SAM-dependent methyltransferase
VFKYPCIGNYYFLDFSITQSPQYPSVLGRLQQGESLLDLACCLGQDIRKLVYDGAPTDNVFGSELERGFIELGFELFKDQDILGKNFSSGDIFSVDVAGLAGKQFDIIHAASFFHLFSWDEQVDAMGRALSLLKPKAGSMIFGRQTAVLEAGEIEHPASRSGSMYRHNVASFTALISQVAKQCGKKVSISVTPQDEMEQLEAAHGWHRMAYGVLLV